MSAKPAVTCDKSQHPHGRARRGALGQTCLVKVSYMGRSSGSDQERQSSTDGAGAAGYAELLPGSPGLARALADPEVAREAGAYAATLPGAPGPVARTGRHVDRGDFVAALAARHGTSERVAAASVRIAEALRATADEYPDLSDEEAIGALRSMEAGVRRAGVPRRPA